MLVRVICFFAVLNIVNVNQSALADDWREVALLDYGGQLFVASSELGKGSGRYGMANLFDRNLASCWAEGKAGDGRGEWLLFAVPVGTTALALANGYQKSPVLFRANNSIATLGMTLFLGISVPGEVTESHILFHLVKATDSQMLSLSRHRGFQNVYLALDWPSLEAFRQQKINQFRHAHGMKGPLKVEYLLELVLKKVDRGSKYNDTCLTEIIPLVGAQQVERIYLDPAETTIFFDTTQEKAIVLGHDPAAVFQIMAIGPYRKWLLVIKMAASGEGRSETIYELYNLEWRQKIPLSLLGKNVGEMYDFNEKNGKVYLSFLNNQSDEVEDLDLDNIAKQLPFTGRNIP